MPSSTKTGEPMLRVELFDGTCDRAVSCTIIGAEHVAAAKQVSFQDLLSLQGLRCTLWQDQLTLMAGQKDPLSVKILEAGACDVPELPSVATVLLQEQSASNPANYLVKVVSVQPGSLTCKDPTGVTASISLAKEASSYRFEVGACLCLHKVYRAKSGQLILYPSGGVEVVSEEDLEGL